MNQFSFRQEKEIKAGRESKPHIAIYGRCNVGKSSLLNFITEGDYAVVSPQAGTTTDPVRKSYEILDFAPVIFIDTAGFDDTSGLGEKRREKTLQTLLQIDLALLVFNRWEEPEERFLAHIEREKLPCLLVYNRIGGGGETNIPDHKPLFEIDILKGSTLERDELLEAIKKSLPESSYIMPLLFEGMAELNDVILLVCPIDSEAPSGRMILPQVQAIRGLLDKNAIAIVVQPEQIPVIFALNIHPRLVVTDSQAFAEVKAVVSQEIPITSFSILLARLKGDYQAYTEGLRTIGSLKSGDRVLILENCMHQTSCEDIGRVKIPRLLQKHTGSELEFTIVTGLSPLPEDLGDYALAVQCGGCMVTRSQLQNRIRAVRRAGVPVTNYGMLLNELL